MKALCFGEVLWDVYLDEKCLGGAPLNFGAHLARHGEDVYMLSAVGRDTLGTEAIEQVKRWGIKDTYVSMLDKKETGKCLVTLDENSVPSYNLLSDVAYDYIPCENIPNDFDVLYFGTLSLRRADNYNALNTLLNTHIFKDVFVDVNIRKPYYTEQTVRFAVEKATVLKVSLEELPTVSVLLGMKETDDYREFASAVTARFSNIKLMIITLGKDGAFAYDRVNDKTFFSPCEKVKVASTVGAGDSFSAAFMHKYFGGAAVQSCLDYANKIARKVVSQMDAVPEYRIEDFA